MKRNRRRAKAFSWKATLGGAAAMYLLDPGRGARRRAHLHDRCFHVYRAGSDLLSKGRRDFAHRAEGLAASVSHLRRAESVPDAVLVERVRARLGRATSHPHAISVEAHDGKVTVSGPVLAGEAPALLAQVRKVRGAAGVVNALEIHDASEHVSSLQGESRRLGRYSRLEFTQDNWTPSLRIGLAAIGIGFGVFGLRRRGGLGAMVAFFGAALLARSLSNIPLRRLTGVGAGPSAVRLHKTIYVSAPIDEVFALFENIEQFPKFMDHVREVRVSGEGRSHWTVAGPANIPISFDAEVTQLVQNQLLAWRTMPGARIQHAGVVHFEESPARRTRLDVQMSYNPIAGALGHLLAKLFRADAKRALDDDLVRFKSLVEEGKTRAHHTPVTLDEVRESPQAPA